MAKFLEDGSSDTKIYVPVKQSLTQQTQSSEAVSTQDLIDPYEINENANEVQNFPLMDYETLKNQINISKDFHLRPMSESEYELYLSYLRNAKDKGIQLFKHDLAAISRIIKENFFKWQPNVELDPLVDESLQYHYEVDNLLSSHYDESLDKYRTPFIVSKAEEVSSLYNADEIQRLRNLGLAFLGDEYKKTNEDVISPTITNKQTLSVPIPKKLLYTHPMLKYGYLKK